MAKLASPRSLSQRMINRRRITAAGLSIVFLFSTVRTTITRPSSTGRGYDSEVQQVMAQGDEYFELSQYSEALKRYHNAVVLASNNQDHRTEARALARLARVEIYLGRNDVAQKHITKALDLLKRDQTAAAKNANGEALTVMGELAQEKGDFKNALTYFDDALKSLDGDQNGQARVHLFIGYITGSIGKLDKAVAEINQARDLYRATNNKAGEGQALTALGLAKSFDENHHDAIELHLEAGEIFRSIGDRHSEAIAFNALGQAYEKLKSYPDALKYYEQALQIFQDIKAVNGTAPTACNVAGIHFLSERFDQALTYYERCLNFSRMAGSVRNEMYALNEIVRVYEKQGRLDFALAQSEKVQKFCRSIGDRRGLAKALNVYGDLLLEKGQKQRALDTYERARASSDEIGDKEILIASLYGLADAKLALGAHEVALSIIQRSLTIIEELRANVASPEFRTSYFSGVQQHYELAIKILAQLDRLHPGGDYGARAFLVSEESRARLLRDLVSESRAKIRAGASKELLDRELALERLIRVKAEYLMDLPSDQTNTAQRAETDDQLAQLKAEYQQVEAQIRQQNPYLSSLEQFAPLSLEQIQKELRGSDTMILEYSLGDEKSYLFAVTSDSIKVDELPGRKSLERASRELYELLTALQGVDGQTSSEYQARIDAAESVYSERARSLSEVLLRAVSERLGNMRLVIVAEGALQLIPFAALPLPGKSQTFLVQTNEIVVEPSLSALIA